MQIRLYNSLTKQIENFVPVSADEPVKVYSCGPTVYSYAHIGNLRAFLFADLLVRVLKHVGKYKVYWVMNVTDIDDKIIRDINPSSSAWKIIELEPNQNNPEHNRQIFTNFYYEKFIKDIEKLHIELDIRNMPLATNFINANPKITQLIKSISDNGYAYERNGSIYFNVSKWKDEQKYGHLKNIDWDNFVAGERNDLDENPKDNIADFVLWKKAKGGEPSWSIYFNDKYIQGRPGWHIECSAMSHAHFGKKFDIHTGGVDLAFPHHENEIAQSHAGYGCVPANYFCHNGFLEVEGQKMSKSLGNVYTLNDLINKEINPLDPLDFRFLTMMAHYRTTLNFTFKGLNAAKSGREKIQNYIYKLLEIRNSEFNFGQNRYEPDNLLNKVYSKLADDLASPSALAEIFTFISQNKAEDFEQNSARRLILDFEKINDVFNVWNFEAKQEISFEIPEEINYLAQQRFNFKREKNWSEADRLRNEIVKQGFSVTDTKDSFIIEKIK